MFISDWVLYFFLYLETLLLFPIVLTYSTEINEDYDRKDSSQVEVRAVFIKCEIDDNLTPYGGETSRFQREELLKHNVLRDCKKKLGLTVKITSDPDQSLSEEYIPIEHVFDGSNKKRIRLLNPYILRLRREPLFEAYKLHKLDQTVRGLIKKSNENINPVESMIRLRRSTHFPNKEQLSSSFPEDHNERTCVQKKFSSGKRIKRYDVDGLPSWFHNGDDYKLNFKDQMEDLSAHPLKNKLSRAPNDNSYRNKDTYKKVFSENDDTFDGPVMTEGSPKIKSNVKEGNSIQSTKSKEITFSYFQDKLNDGDTFNKKTVRHNVSTFRENENILNLDVTGKSFDLYQISAPELWFAAHVQLYEKLSTPEGKTIWRDINKEEPAGIATSSPEWTNEDLHIRYRSVEWLPREDFTLVSRNTCLLLPQSGHLSNDYNHDKSEQFIIIPCEDIESIDEDNYNFNKRLDNYSAIETSPNVDTTRLDRVLIRVSRAFFGNKKENYVIVDQGRDKYLRIPSRQQHHAQIDLEARSDENQLVYVGLSGRLTTIVSDTTRRTRSILTIQASNTGLAAAHFRVQTRDCDPNIIPRRINEEEKDVDLMLVPPRHTRSYRLELPLDIPVEVVRCSVALINDDEESVAVRDVRIRQGDRCFCVWHCDCVCLDEDPKLQCQDMSENQQMAAGLSLHKRPRSVRAACYPDDVTINLLVVVIGVIFLLLTLGALKANLGLFCKCVGSWGIDQLIQTPRRLDHYYESSLRSRPVEYDEDGWPVHPDTKKRTVRLISKSMEFMLNIIFFIILPCLILRNSLTKIISICHNKEKHSLVTTVSKTNTKKCFSSHDMQTTEARWRWRRRGRGLSRWMTPQAEELSTSIWRNGLAPPGPNQAECMRPLLREERCRGKLHELQSSVVDSEQEDTEYVVTQMQRSKESLSKKQRKTEALHSYADK